MLNIPVLRTAHVIVFAAALLGAAACSSSGSSDSNGGGTTTGSGNSTTAAASTPSSSVQGSGDTATAGASSNSQSGDSTGAPVGDVVVTNTPGGSSTDWVTWNKKTCTFEPATDHPASYTAQVRKPSGELTIGYGEQGTGNPLLDAMNSGMTSTADKAGIKLAIGNYNYPDKSDALSQAQAIALRNPQAVISFNVDKTILDSLNKNYSDKCIPIVQVTLAAPNTIVFGASDDGVGKAAGDYLVDYAKKQGWDPSTIVAYGVQVPSLAGINARVTTCQDTITSALAGAKTDSTQIAASTTANAQTATTNWLTAHPDVKHILGCNIADVLALGEVNALQAANRTPGSAILGAGGTASVLALVGKTALVGSVDFGYSHYADFLLAMAEDAIDGHPVPTKVYTPLTVVTSA